MTPIAEWIAYHPKTILFTIAVVSVVLFGIISPEPMYGSGFIAGNSF